MPKYKATLWDLIKKKTEFTENLIHRVAIHTLEGLVELQQQKIIHRDIKPSNIFLAATHEGGDNYYYSIGDMEAANFLSEGISHISGGTGTFAHLAPE